MRDENSKKSKVLPISSNIKIFFFFFSFFSQGNEIQHSECFGVCILQVVDCFVFLLLHEALMVKENGQEVL